MSEYSCTKDSMGKLLQEHPKLAIMFTQKDCQPCQNFRSLVGEIGSDLKGLEVAEVELGRGELDCESLADVHEVKGTPTIVYYEKGKAVKSWTPSIDKEEEKKNLLELASQETFGEVSELPLPSIRFLRRVQPEPESVPLPEAPTPEAPDAEASSP